MIKKWFNIAIHTAENCLSPSYTATNTPWVWGLPEGKWLGLGSAQVSFYPWGCGYTVKPPSLRVKYNFINRREKCRWTWMSRIEI